eukprot:2933916-Rhodomonas_salina.1
MALLTSAYTITQRVEYVRNLVQGKKKENEKDDENKVSAEQKKRKKIKEKTPHSDKKHKKVKRKKVKPKKEEDNKTNETKRKQPARLSSPESSDEDNLTPQPTGGINRIPTPPQLPPGGIN